MLQLKHFNHRLKRTDSIKGIVFCFLSMLALGACSDNNNDKTEAKSAEAVQENWSEFVDSVEEYSVAERNELVGRAEKQLTQFDKTIDSLEDKLAEEQAEATESIAQDKKAIITDIKQKRERLGTSIEEVKNSGVYAWAEVKNGFADAYEDLSTSLEAAIDEFQDDKKDKNS